MRDNGPGREVPGWSTPAFDPNFVRSVKTPFSGQYDDLPAVSNGMELTHVGREMLAYWHGTRGTNPMPDTSQISPKDFRELLPYSRYLSWEAADDLRIRVFGSALSTAFGADLTGTNLLDLMGPDQYDDELAAFKMLHGQPCGSVTIRRSYIAGGGSREIELLHLPVAAISNSGDGMTNGDRIIGSIMLREVPDHWDGTSDRSKPMDLLERSFIDIGFGVPDGAEL
ncbi:hypothetical protein BN1012_Phect1558 [Candidatus Phaeomarinobacter ectocarpi]|uniref:PAS domain-containing protein n=1 Tax=Candidatus Phaeomarinibacter ectocarpi TaxID=1458461 RepID=X5MD19_9HYPH|nr:PAS domain-containing protein [Candidatus Phaeomarinobacter ectocarpi]CDO59772.1 hypothetical protein BN1012_Phect1558 [Candidatus Phaeomarinobacter ectocarpi]